MTPATSTPPLPSVPHRDAVLTREQLAAALQVPPSTVDRMDLPTVWCGKNRYPRFIYGQVLDTLQERAA